MKRTEPMSIRQIIDRVMDTSASGSQFLEQRASFLWADVVGPGVNRQTIRRYVARGELHVYIASAPLKGELEYQRAAIRDAINKILGKEVLKAVIIH